VLHTFSKPIVKVTFGKGKKIIIFPCSGLVVCCYPVLFCVPKKWKIGFFYKF